MERNQAEFHDFTLCRGIAIVTHFHLNNTNKWISLAEHLVRPRLANKEAQLRAMNVSVQNEIRPVVRVSLLYKSKVAKCIFDVRTITSFFFPSRSYFMFYSRSVRTTHLNLLIRTLYKYCFFHFFIFF